MDVWMNGKKVDCEVLLTVINLKQSHLSEICLQHRLNSLMEAT